jgi:hypothetical protein
MQTNRKFSFKETSCETENLMSKMDYSTPREVSESRNGEKIISIWEGLITYITHLHNTPFLGSQGDDGWYFLVDSALWNHSYCTKQKITAFQVQRNLCNTWPVIECLLNLPQDSLVYLMARCPQIVTTKTMT